MTTETKSPEQQKAQLVDYLARQKIEMDPPNAGITEVVTGVDAATNTPREVLRIHGICMNLAHPIFYLLRYIEDEDNLPKLINSLNQKGGFTSTEISLIISDISPEICEQNVRTFLSEYSPDMTHEFNYVSEITDKEKFITRISRLLSEHFSEPESQHYYNVKTLIPNGKTLTQVIMDDHEIQNCLSDIDNLKESDFSLFVRYLISVVVPVSLRVPKKSTVLAHLTQKLQNTITLFDEQGYSFTPNQVAGLIEQIKDHVNDTYKVFRYQPKKHMLVRAGYTNFYVPHIGWTVVHQPPPEGVYTVKVIEKEEYESFMKDDHYNSYKREFKEAVIPVNTLVNGAPNYFTKKADDTSE